MWNKIWNPSNKKVLALNVFAAFALNLFLEWMERKNLAELISFIQGRTFVFLFNVFIIFITLSIVFLVKKKYFTFGLICVFWGMIGLINGIILKNRNTPFTVVDLTIIKSTIPIINSYFAVWQIVLILIVLVIVIAGFVTLFLYCPSAKKEFDFKTNLGIVLIFLGIFGVSAYLGVGRGLLISKFDNLIAGYKDYGVAYGFCITSMDTGIDRPIDYSRNRVKKISKLMKKRLKKLEKKEKSKKKPNVIFIQLESFFDLTDVKGIQLSEDPLPNLHRIQKETTSGYVTVPVYGAGTINTEFEMITGMNVGFFGTGEYPYRSILHKRTCESMAYWMKENGYTATALHNNNASFYDRDYVFANLGFDRFITSENMNITEYNKIGWAKDIILEESILDIMKSTEKQDYIYAISVQGHGEYPSNLDGMVLPIEVNHPDWDEKQKNMVTYYANQIHEMDEFLGSLTDNLANYPEETLLVVYGDHLPGLGFDSEQLTTESKYKTPYFIWDNYGYHSKAKHRKGGNIKAYQMVAKVLQPLGIHNGVMNLYHQTMSRSKNYKKNMKLLQYDLLYGSGFIREGQEELLRSDLQYAIRDVKIKKLKQTSDYLYIVGDSFTRYSRVYVNGVLIPSSYNSRFSLKIANLSVKDEDEIVIHQVSKTNENITFNQSEPFLVKMDEIVSLYEDQ